MRTGLPPSSSVKISSLNPGGRLMESREPESMDGWWRVLWMLWPGMPLWLWKIPWPSGIFRLLFISHRLRSLTGSICIVFQKTSDFLWLTNLVWIEHRWHGLDGFSRIYFRIRAHLCHLCNPCSITILLLTDDIWSHMTKNPIPRRLENILLKKPHPRQPWLKYNACAVRFVLSRILLRTAHGSGPCRWPGLLKNLKKSPKQSWSLKQKGSSLICVDWLLW